MSEGANHILTLYLSYNISFMSSIVFLLCGIVRCLFHTLNGVRSMCEWVSEKGDSSLWNCVSKQCFCFFRMRWWHRYSQRRTLFNLLVVYFIIFLILRKIYIHFSYKKLRKTLSTALHPFFRPFKLTLFILFIFLILNTPRLSRGKN